MRAPVGGGRDARIRREAERRHGADPVPPGRRYLPTVPVKISRPATGSSLLNLATIERTRADLRNGRCRSRPPTRSPGPDCLARCVVDLQRAAGAVERCGDRRTFAASAGLTAAAERRLADHGPAEDLAGVVFGV